MQRFHSLFRALNAKLTEHNDTAAWGDYGLFLETQGVLDVGGESMAYEIVQHDGFGGDYWSLDEGGQDAYLVLKIDDAFYRAEGTMYSHGGFELYDVFTVKPQQVTKTVYARVIN